MARKNCLGALMGNKTQPGQYGYISGSMMYMLFSAGVCLTQAAIVICRGISCNSSTLARWLAFCWVEQLSLIELQTTFFREEPDQKPVLIEIDQVSCLIELNSFQVV